MRSGWILSLALLLFAVDISRADIPAQPPTENEIRSAFQWFDSLKYPDIGSLPFVEISGGYCTCESIGGDHHRFGFLIKDSGASFTAFLPDLETLTFTKGNPSAQSRKVAAFRIADIKQAASNALVHLGRIKEAGLDDWDGFSDENVTVPELFVLACACSSHGLGALPVDLVSKTCNALWKNEPGIPFAQTLANSMAAVALEQNVKKFPRPTVSRKELAESVQQVADRFPGTPAGKEASNYAVMIRRMIQEDSERPHQAAAGGDLQERVAGLIYRLREQTVTMSYIEFRGLNKDTSPAAEIARIGIRAVPQLIGAIEARRITRCVVDISTGWTSMRVNGQYVNVNNSHRQPLLVGDYALGLIDYIADARFSNPETTDEGAIKPEKLASVVSAVSAWWSRYRPDEDLRYLSTAVALADIDAVGAADLLVRRFPADADAALTKGLQSAHDDRTRKKLMEAVGKAAGPGSVALLASQAASGAPLPVRVAAYNDLIERGSTAGVPGIVSAWLSIPFSALVSESTLLLIENLSLSGDPAGVYALGNHLAARPAAVRAAVVAAFESGKYRDAMTGMGTFYTRQRTPDARQKSVEHAVENLLAAELGDYACQQDLIQTSAQSFYRARISDIAAEALGRLFPNRYHYIEAGTLQEADTEVTIMYNTWAAANGANKRNIPVLVKLTDVRSALMAAVAAQNTPKCDSLLYAVEANGAAALPALSAALKGPISDPNTKSAIAAVASRLGNQLVDVDIDADTHKLLPDLSRRMDALRGKSLTGSRCVEVMREWVEWGLSKGNVKVGAQRLDGKPGIYFTARVTRSALAKSDSRSCNYEIRVEAVGRPEYERSGGGGWDKKYRPAGPISHDRFEADEFQKAVIPAFAGAPFDPFVVTVNLTLN